MKDHKDNLPVSLDLPGATFRVAEWGETAMGHVTFAAGIDAAPLLKGLPHDLCPCPHWGYVTQGSIHVRYADSSEEVVRAGECFYWPPGHTVWTDEPVTLIEFSPKEQLREVYDHIRRAVAAASGLTEPPPVESPADRPRPGAG